MPNYSTRKNAIALYQKSVEIEEKIGTVQCKAITLANADSGGVDSAVGGVDGVAGL